ncbi:hypothetical protein D9611_006449 [Ephemerocybe angulata]|uniref:Uncharacterized protein n=1 Tax=Ephemerocybe angulata TaxID=980116 RepID=A0A8H5FHA7_9AGAR|nr:hypothetical protein D9611_006449 [Tulosesus angulatus]
MPPSCSRNVIPPPTSLPDTYDLIAAATIPASALVSAPFPGAPKIPKPHAKSHLACRVFTDLTLMEIGDGGRSTVRVPSITQGDRQHPLKYQSGLLNSARERRLRISDCTGSQQPSHTNGPVHRVEGFMYTGGK